MIKKSVRRIAGSLEMAHQANFYGRKLQKLLSRCDKIEFAEAIWVLNTARGNPQTSMPFGYDYPLKFVTAKIGDEGAIFGWELETLLNYLFGLRSNYGKRKLNPKAWQAVSTIVNCLRKLEDGQSNLPSIDGILESMTRLLYRQLPWQEHHGLRSPVAARWWIIFCSPNLQRAFKEATGVEVIKFIRLSLALYELFRQKCYIRKPVDFSSVGLTVQDIDLVMTMLSRTESEASQTCSRVSGEAREVAYRENPFRKRPLISIKRNNLVEYMCPLQQLLAWRITKGLYYDVMSISDAPRMIGAAFEEYLLNFCKKAFPEANVIGKFNYGSRQRPKLSPDIIVSLEDEIILVIECKSKRATKAVQLQLGPSREKETAIKEMAKGIAQLTLFQARLVNGEIDGRKASPNLRSLVVTLDDWIFWGDSMDSEVVDRAKSLFESASIENTDMHDVAFCNAFDFERLAGNYTIQQLVDIIPASRVGEYRTHRLWDFASSNFERKDGGWTYPLKEDLDLLLKT